MRVLATGITRLECGLRPQLKYISNAELFVDALRRGGAEVDFRVTVPDEDLSGYDVVLVGMGAFLSITASYLYSTISVIERAADAGCALVFYMDDWQFTRTLSHLRTIVNTGSYQLTKDFFSSKPHYQWILDNTDRAMATCQKLLEKPWPVTIIPTATWGDHAKLIKDVPSERIECLDPSAIAELYHDVPVVDPTDKQRTWVLGALKDERPWLESLNLTWETRYLGGVASKAKEKLPEAELVKLYAQSWGVLSPPHKRVLGTGWWRYRFTAAHRAGCVLLMDEREAPSLGELFAVKPAAVEQLSTAELAELAGQQAAVYDREKMPLDDLISRVTTIVQGAQLW